MSYTVILRAITLYPVKSLPGVSVNNVQLDDWGLLDDRRWMLVDARGRFVSQRSVAAMAKFHVHFLEGNWVIEGFRQGVTPRCTLPARVPAGEPSAVRIWNDEVTALKAPAALSEWFSEQLGMAVTLVRYSADTHRQVARDYAQSGDEVAFADGFPLLVANQASLDDLNAQAGLSLDGRRFRANLTIEGAPALSELSAQRLSVVDGSGSIALVKPCERCNIPAIDPDTTEYQGSVASALKEHCHWHGKTIFGMNGIARGLDRLVVGQRMRLE
ncbi:MAG: MOSC domain-containing protein [Saccharospirillum sp.]